MRTLLASLGLVGLLLAGSGCDAPTLPLPPPMPLVSSPDAEGYVTISGSDATPGALVLAFNEDMRIGRITEVDVDGMYSMRLEAACDDVIQVWVKIGPDDSEQVEIIVTCP